MEGNATLGAGLALAVTALVVAFVMALVVRERTKEIGVLKALGATNGSVALQFVGEAVGLSLVAGLLGTGLYILAGPALARFLLPPVATATAQALHGATDPLSAIGVRAAAGVVGGSGPGCGGCGGPGHPGEHLPGPAGGPAPSRGGHPGMTEGEALRADGVTKDYRMGPQVIRALDEVSFTLPRGLWRPSLALPGAARPPSLTSSGPWTGPPPARSTWTGWAFPPFGRWSSPGSGGRRWASSSSSSN